jgi:hypothetical protein
LRTGLDQGLGSGDGKARFGFTIDHLKPEAGFGINPLDKFQAVFGHPTRLRGNQPAFGDISPDELVGADAQRFDRAAHGGIAQPASLTRTLSEANYP